MAFECKSIIDEEKRIPVIYPIGELDIYVSEEFKKKVLDIYNNEKSDIYFDFSKLEYIDSTGLGAMISILKELLEDDHRIYLKDVNPKIRKLFKITKLEEMFTFIGDSIGEGNE